MLKFYLEIFYNFRGSFVGLWLILFDYNDEGIKVIGLEGVDLIMFISDL